MRNGPNEYLALSCIVKLKALDVPAGVTVSEHQGNWKPFAGVKGAGKALTLTRTRGLVVYVAAFLFTVCSLPAAIRFDDFSSIQKLNLVGDAAVSGTALRLTHSRWNRSGAAWLREKQTIAAGFETTFQFQLTHQHGVCGGGDGFALVLQNSGPEALGGRGMAGGFAVTDPSNPRHPGIPRSIAIFFDTCRNPEEGDPSSNYIAVCTTGRPAEMRWPAKRLAFTPNLDVQLKDGHVHTARIVFQPPILSVFLDSSQVLATVADLSIVIDSEGKAWAGFTASTGWGFQNHDILNWSFEGGEASSNVSMVSSEITFLMANCLPDHNLCTPERAIVEGKGASYHVILPGNLEWGVSIPNPDNRAVVIGHPHGIVCWNKTAGSEECSGPSGKAAQAGVELLREDVLPGALIMRNREGRTWFSVNGRAGDSFKDQEGFYEFDVQIE